MYTIKVISSVVNVAIPLKRECHMLRLMDILGVLLVLRNERRGERLSVGHAGRLLWESILLLLGENGIWNVSDALGVRNLLEWMGGSS